MITPLAIIASVREYGGDLCLLPDGQRLVIEHRSRVPDEVAAEAKAHAEELRAFLRANASATSTTSIESTVSASSTDAGRFARWHAGDLARVAQRHGARLLLEEHRLRIDVSDAHEMPEGLLEAIRAKAPSVIRYLHRLESQADLQRRFGPLSRRGRLCRGCFTIELVRQLGGVDCCDDCLLDLTRGVVAAASAERLIVGAT